MPGAIVDRHMTGLGSFGTPLAASTHPRLRAWQHRRRSDKGTPSPWRRPAPAGAHAWWSRPAAGRACPGPCLPQAKGHTNAGFRARRGRGGGDCWRCHPPCCPLRDRGRLVAWCRCACAVRRSRARRAVLVTSLWPARRGDLRLRGHSQMGISSIMGGKPSMCPSTWSPRRLAPRPWPASHGCCKLRAGRANPSSWRSKRWKPTLSCNEVD